MDLRELTIDPLALSREEAVRDEPLVFVDLSSASQPADIVLPPYPVVGIGKASHPLAEALDAVVERPVTASAIAEQVLAHPRAAAAIVQLLRVLPGLSMQAGLTAESFTYAMLQGSAEHGAWLERREAATGRAVGEGSVKLEREGLVLTITLDRPEAGNAIDRAMRDGLYEALSLASLDTEIERVVLRAAGKAFSLGAELSEFGTTRDPATAHAIRMRTLPARQAIGCADRLEAHIAGACVGAGLELAGFARRITAARNAWFQLPELAMGILPGAGGCVSLARRIGRQRTALMILSGTRINARKALDWGLVDALVDEPA
jgi:hypothetical protein